MVSWLAKTTQLLQRRQPPEPPPPFELGCACGHHVTGMRKPTFQAITCHRCGNVLFVLPTDVYPKPKVKKSAANKASPAPSPQPIARVKAAEPASVPATRTKSSSPASAAAGAATRTGAPTATPPPDEALTADSVTIDLRRPLVSRFSLVVLAISSVVAATGYFVWQSRLNDRALVSLPNHLEAAVAALRGGNLPVAAEEYRQAAWAVDRLKRDDAESTGIRQKAKELHAIVNLSAVPLFDICEHARLAAPAGAEKWTEKFNQVYRDSWIVIEGDLIQDTGPDGTGQPMVRFPFPIDVAPVVFDARLKALDALPVKGGSRHVIFAAQLASLTKEGTKNPLWMIRLKDDSAFLWADYETYRALGLAPDAPGEVNETRQILNEQAASLGLKP
jgi:hypothetical protein